MLAAVLVAGSLAVQVSAPSSAEAAPSVLPTGTLTVQAGQTDANCHRNGQPSDSTCTKFEISGCPAFAGGTLPVLTGYYSFAPALSTPRRGMVVMFSGGGGNLYWGNWDGDGSEPQERVPAEFVAKLRSHPYSFDVVQVRWAKAWEDAAEGQDAGASRVACRPATVVKHLREQVYVAPTAPPVTGQCGFCLLGSSGGGSQIAFPVTHYGLGSWTSGGTSYRVDGVIATGGPVHTEQAKGCIPGREHAAYALDGGSAKQLDAPMGYTSLQEASPWYYKKGPCRTKATTVPALDRWNQESIATSAPTYVFPSTRFHFIVGRLDTAIRLGVTDFATALWRGAPAGQPHSAAGSPFVTFQIVNSMGHGVTRSVDGMAALESAVTRTVASTFSGCGNGVDDDDDGSTDAADGGCATSPENEISPGGPVCDNGVDEDRDGRPDYGPLDTYEDKGCASPTDPDERTPSTACDDGVDNNGNGPVDFPADLECATATDDTEGVPTTTYPLTVATRGVGTVTSNHGGISCPGACSAQYGAGATVVLTAAAGRLHTFSHWEGCDQVNNNNIECTMTMDMPKTDVTAVFTKLGTVTLTISPEPTGGTVTSPDGISCPSDCSEEYLEDASESVTLTANAALGYAFQSWTDACAGTTGPECTLTMSESRTVGATFAELPKVLLEVSPPPDAGQGDVRATDVGIDCPDVACSAQVGQGSTVTLTATANPGWAVSTWTGCDSSSASTCTVTMDDAKNVSASFVQASAVTLTISPPPSDGTVSSNPPGITCGAGGASCSADFSAGSTVTLSTAPTAGKVFVGWSGGCAGARATCSILMDQARSVGATFAPGRLVSVTDYRFTPKVITGLGFNDAIRWEFGGPNAHSVVDTKNLGSSGASPAPLFASGSRLSGDAFVFRFCAAGLYSYASPNEPQVMTGTVSVPMTTSAATVGPNQPVSVRWACAPMTGFTFQVQQRFKAPGSSKWGTWKTSSWAPPAADAGTFSGAAGSYQLRARIKNTATQVVGGFSPNLPITVQ